MQIVVLNNQSLSDIAIRYCGSVDALIDIAVLNDLSITADLYPGKLIEIPVKDYGNKEVVGYFAANRIQPATTLTEEDILIMEGDSGGIGYWIIENNFIVQ